MGLLSPAWFRLTYKPIISDRLFRYYCFFGIINYAGQQLNDTALYPTENGMVEVKVTID